MANNESKEEKLQRAIDQVLEDLSGWNIGDSKKIISEVMIIKQGD